MQRKLLALGLVLALAGLPGLALAQDAALIPDDNATNVTGQARFDIAGLGAGGPSDTGPPTVATPVVSPPTPSVLAVGPAASVTPPASCTPSAAVTPAAAVATAAATASPAQRALDRINCYRARAGVAPLTLDDTLNRSATAHVSYYVSNYGDPSLSGMGLHEETPGKPGFTGADSDARAKAAGSTDWYVDENIGLGGSPEATVDWFVNSVNHRENLLHPDAIHLGYASSANPPIDVFDIGFGGDRPTVALPSVFPGDHQTGVSTSVDLEETPDPAPGVPRPLGYPLTISFATQDQVTFSSSSLTGPGGEPVQIYTAAKPWLRTLALIPAKPLAAGTTYTAQVSGTVNGQPFTKNWSFTTS